MGVVGLNVSFLKANKVNNSHLMISVVQSEWGLAHLDVGEVFFKEIPKSLSNSGISVWLNVIKSISSADQVKISSISKCVISLKCKRLS